MCRHHAEVRFCPLYLAAHDPALAEFGCDDGELGNGGCAVDRGVDYRTTCASIEAKRPRVIAVLRFAEEAAAAAEQRARNLRLSGVH